MRLNDLEPGWKPVRRKLPKEDLAAYWITSFVTAIVVFSLGVISMRLASYQNWYGYTPFLILPTVGGLCAGGMSFRFQSIRSAGWKLPFWSLLQVAGLMLIFAREGIICLAMAAPLGYLGMVAGYHIAVKIAGIQPGPPPGLQLSLIPICLAGGYVGLKFTPTTGEAEESTTLVISAPPHKIWPLLFNLKSVPKPTFIPFRAGVAHPLRTESDGTQPGAARRCVLSTGTMEETISISEPNRHLRFLVTKTPDAMTEYNPLRETNLEHGADYFWVNWGEFRLKPLSDGRTELTGTSRYSYRLYPASYWKLWADSMVEQTHLLVMQEIKRRAEQVPEN